METQDRVGRRYVGVDVGGTKIVAVVAEQTGRVVSRHRLSSPREGGSTRVLAAITEAIEAALARAGESGPAVAAIGIGVPGVVEPSAGVLVLAPNMDFEGPVAAPISERFGVPVAVGNDANVAALAEQRFGAAHGAESAVGIFVGTGIGAGIICHGRLVEGARQAAGEIGHIVMQIGGPLCGCGNRGCLEAMASRTAIERDLRAGVAEGTPTLLTELLGADLSVIRSNALRRCLAAEDPLVTRVMQRASEILGHACLTVRHLLDPEVIVLGGGVTEACGDFLLPIVQGILDADKFLSARPARKVVRAALGDDAGALGAVALAEVAVGDLSTDVDYRYLPHYPTLESPRPGEIVIDGEPYASDVTLRADGQVKKRRKPSSAAGGGSWHVITADDIERVCKGDPEVVFIATGYEGRAALAPEAEELLARRGIPSVIAPTPEAVAAYNRAEGRKAVLVHVSR